ncbi:MAG: hypothetical protein ACYDCO_01310 [Armatimonadota bacterium]
MSWDILIASFPPDIADLEEMPDDYQMEPLGNRDEIIHRISDIIPGVDFSDPSWGRFEAEDFSIEFNIRASGDICESIMLHVRGEDDAVPVISHLLQGLELRALDCQTSEFFDPAAAEESFAEWQAFRDRAIDATSAQGKK